MSYFGNVNVRIDSDWATFQLMTEGARVEQLLGHKYPEGTVFTEVGMVFGQPNEQLQPRMVKIPFAIRSDRREITFFTGKGDIGTTGPQGGCITVMMSGREYNNTGITGDGLNIKGFYNVPLLSV